VRQIELVNFDVFKIASVPYYCCEYGIINIGGLKFGVDVVENDYMRTMFMKEIESDAAPVFHGSTQI